MLDSFLSTVESHPSGALIIGAAIGTTIVFIIKGVVKLILGIRRERKKRHDKDFMIHQCNKSINIQTILTSFAGASRAKTVSVCRFRNGKHYFDSTPIMYVDMTEEGLVPTMRKTKKTFHGQYINDMAVELKAMIEADKPLRLLKSDLEQDNPFREYMDLTGLKSIVLRRLKINKQIIGFVMMGFDYEIEENDCLMQANTLIDTETNALKPRVCKYECDGCPYRSYMLNIKKEMELAKSV